MVDYKESLIKVEQDKRRKQAINAETWLKEVEGRNSRLEELKRIPYDPELIWNIETP